MSPGVYLAHRCGLPQVDARNQLETYCYNMKNSVADADKLADKLEEEDKASIDEAVTDALEWMDENSDADVEEYKEKLKEVRVPSSSGRWLGGGVWSAVTREGFRWEADAPSRMHTLHHRHCTAYAPTT
jgi:hypothetical protein